MITTPVSLRGILLSLFGLAAVPFPSTALGQEPTRLFPDPSLSPTLLAGARDPATSATLYYLGRNPDAYGEGIEAEISIGISLPVFILAGTPQSNPVVLGIEGAAFARFGFQITERELVGSDWVFALPVVWHRPKGWTRLRYYHTSSHLGDEYARRFGEAGINFSRDALELLTFRALSPGLGVYGGVRVAYNVHPEDSRRWVLRTGGQIEAKEDGRVLRPFLAVDLEWDESAGGSRVEAKAGSWLPRVRGRRVLHAALVFLTGPSPLGQFNGRSTTQIGLGLQGIL